MHKRTLSRLGTSTSNDELYVRLKLEMVEKFV